MKVLVSLLPLEIQWQPELWPRPLGLWQSGGKPLIDHVLEELRAVIDAPAADVRFVTADKQNPLAVWVNEQYAGGDDRAKVIEVPGVQTIFQIAWHMRDWWAANEPVWLLEACAVLETKFDDDDSEIRLLVAHAGENKAFAGLYFKSGGQLSELLSKYAELPPAFDLFSLWERDLAEYRLEKPFRDTIFVIHTFLPLAEWTEAGWGTRREWLLEANARLLGLGSGSQNAIERSYVEDFTVLPPVYIDDSALVFGSVIGPYTSVEAGARINNSIVSNSIIGANATIDNILLDSSLIGQAAVVNGCAETLSLGDEQEYSKK